MANAAPYADMLIIASEGSIRPFADERRVEALAIYAGKVIAAGKLTELESLRRPHSQVLKLEPQQCLLPGFNDAHIHIWKKGHLLTTMLDLSEVRSIEDIRQKVAARAQELQPGQWLLGRGYNEARLQEKRKPTRYDLDDISPHNPVCLTRTCAHIHSLNSLALQQAGIDAQTLAPSGGAIDLGDDGQPNGLLFETAYGLVQRHIPAFSSAQLQTMIRAAGEYLLRLGVTSATDPAIDAPLLEAYRSLEHNQTLPLRCNLLYIRRPDGGSDTLPLPEKQVSAMLRLDAVKFFSDGGLSGATAKLREPYRNTEKPSDGILRFETEELFALAYEAHHAGFRIASHAIGDVAITQLLEVYSRLQQQDPQPLLRHRIEHFGLPDAEQLRQAAALQLIAVPQSIFIRELGETFARYLPAHYLPRCYNLRAMLDAGLTVALSTDGPVVRDLNPLSGIHAAVTMQRHDGQIFNPEGGISLSQAFQAYTLGGAEAQGDSDNRGTLSPGRWADMVILDADPWQQESPDAWLEHQVAHTFLAGSSVYQA